MWQHTVAERLGCTVAELGERIDSPEFFAWIQYYTQPEQERQEREQAENIERMKDLIWQAAPRGRN